MQTVFEHKHKQMDGIVKLMLDKVTGGHTVLTPHALASEILDAIPVLSGKILVIANIEWCYELMRRGHDGTDITFVSPCYMKNKFVDNILPKVTIWEYGWDYFLNTGINMKFDVIVGNPPYQSTEDGSKRKNRGLNLQ